MQRRVVTVFGGSGFIGRHLIQRLAADGWVVRVAVRDPIRAQFLRPNGDVGQIVPIKADINDRERVAAACTGAAAVINLVGVLFEKGRQSFDRCHREGAAIVAAAAREAGAQRLLHMSALGADKSSPAAYARSKAAGEEAVQAAFPGATIFRPSVVFGPEDDFFNRFAKMAATVPVLPVFTGDGFKVKLAEGGVDLDLYGSGGPTFQPVYVGDVADAFLKALNDPATAGKVFELGGPRRYSLKEIYELIARVTGRCIALVPMPFWAGDIVATFAGLMPKPGLTKDQMLLMRTDNVARGGKPGLAELGIAPTAAEAILPMYLDRFRKGPPNASMRQTG